MGIDVGRDGRRRVGFTGVLNFRDLGGYETASGRLTRWATIYRSGTLYNLDGNDLDVFDALGIKTIFDLRREAECTKEPGPRSCVFLELPSRVVSATDPVTLRTAEDGERWLFEDYVGMLENGGHVIGGLFSRLADPDSLPSVFHCTGGKDRTGLTAALLLSLLGVEREAVLDDYELTARYSGPAHLPQVVDLFVNGGIARPAAEAILGAPRSAMAEALGQLDARYGGVDSYLCGPGQMTEPTLVQIRHQLTRDGAQRSAVPIEPPGEDG